MKVFNARGLRNIKAGLWGFGADFDNMKIRCWYEHHFPLLTDESTIPDLRKAAQTAARLLSLLRSALKEAWFDDPKGARGDFSFIDIDFWNQTQPLFLNLIHELENGPRRSGWTNGKESCGYSFVAALTIVSLPIPMKTTTWRAA